MVLTLPEAKPEVPKYGLYSARVVAWISALFSPAAGFILIATNYARVGRTSSVMRTLGVGTVVFLSWLMFAWLTESNLLSLVVGIVLAVIIGKTAGFLQQPMLSRHLDLGGAKGSGWIGAGIGLLCIAGTLGLVAALAVFGPAILRNEYRSGNVSVYYLHGASREHAQAVAVWAAQGNPDHKIKLLVEKPRGVYAITLSVGDNPSTEPEAQRAYCDAATELSTKLHGPVRVVLTDESETRLGVFASSNAALRGMDDAFGSPCAEYRVSEPK